LEWSIQWIRDHAQAQYDLNKPVVAEEYGYLADAQRLEYLGKVSFTARTMLLERR